MGEDHEQIDCTSTPARCYASRGPLLFAVLIPPIPCEVDNWMGGQGGGPLVVGEIIFELGLT